jgi:predicted hotdog family 3-hydroxylacyl-ACP dehydratase
MNTRDKYKPAELLPHSGAMMLLDRIIEVGDEHLRAAACVRAQCPLSRPGDTGLPAFAGLEFMAQAAAAWAGYRELAAGRSVRPGLLLGTRRFDSSQPWLSEGLALDIHIERMLEDESGIGAFDCRIEAPGLRQQARIKAVMPRSMEEFMQLGGY